MKSTQRAFLAAFHVSGSITRSAEAAKVDRAMHYRWLDDLKYRAAFDAARDMAAATLEDEAVRRAHEGVLKPIFYKGKPSGAIREYSDALLMFLLRGYKPETFRDRSAVEVTGANGGPVEMITRLNAGRDRAAKRGG